MWNYTATLENSSNGAYPSFRVNGTNFGTNGPWTNALILVNVQTMSTTTLVSDDIFGAYTKVTSILQADGKGESSLWISGPHNYTAWNSAIITATVTTGSNVGSPAQTSQSSATATVLIPSDTYTASGVVTSVSAITGTGPANARTNPQLIEAFLVADPGTQMFWTIGTNNTLSGGFNNFLGVRSPIWGSGGDVGGINSTFRRGTTSAYNNTDSITWAPITPLGAGTRTLDYNIVSDSSFFPGSGWNWTAIGVSLTYPGSAPVIVRNRITNFITNSQHWNTNETALVNTTTRTCPPYEFVWSQPSNNFYSPMAPILAGDTILCCFSNTTNVQPTGVSDNINGAYTFIGKASSTSFYFENIFIYTFTSSAAIPNPGRDWVVTASANSTTDWSIFTIVLSPGAELDQFRALGDVITINRNVVTTNMVPQVFTSNANEWFLSLYTSEDNFIFVGAAQTWTGQPQHSTSGVASRLAYNIVDINTYLPGQTMSSPGSIPSGFITDGRDITVGSGGAQGQIWYAWIETTWKTTGTLTAVLPVATVKFYKAVLNVPLMVYAPGLTTNNVGVGQTVTAHTNPSHGTLSNFSTNGSFTYTPTTSYTGNDLFNYTITDIYGQTSSADVIITVSPFDGLGVVMVQNRIKK